VVVGFFCLMLHFGSHASENSIGRKQGRHVGMKTVKKTIPVNN